MRGDIGLDGALNESDVRNVRKILRTARPVAAGAGVGVARVSGIACAERSGQRRAEVQPLAGDEVTVGSFDQASLSTGLIDLCAPVGSNSWERKEFCSVCPGRSERTELGRLIPAARGPLLCIVAQRFVPGWLLL